MMEKHESFYILSLFYSPNQTEPKPKDRKREKDIEKGNDITCNISLM